jgi:glycerol-3-phosphate acyltransferase PlsY
MSKMTLLPQGTGKMIFVYIAVGYLLGSIPFGLVLTRLAGYGDIRRIGSGNIGATNVLRTGNKALAALTLVLDGGKGAAAFLIAAHIGGYDMGLLAGGAALAGHLFPVWLKFKGGKGVATTLGLFIAAAPLVGVLACATWLVMAFTFRYSSLSALVAMLVSPLLAYTFHDGDFKLAGLCALCAAVVWWRHKANIQRLLKGEEPKIGRKKDTAA